MDDKIKDALNPDSDFHRKLLQHCKRLTEVSRSYMSRFYTQWDANDKTIRGERIPDEQDKKASQRGEPIKMILPFTYAQTQTFVAFMISLFGQRSKFFEIEDNGEGDLTPEQDAEDCIAYDLSRSQFAKVQYQCFLDVARSAFCVVKSLWFEEAEQQTVQVEQPPTTTLFGAQLPGSATATQKVFTKQGNRVVSISPYHFFPDIRLPLSRLHEGEFCASEDEFSIVRLKQMQSDGLVTNIDKIKPLGQEGMQNRRLNYLNASNYDNFKTIMGEIQGGGMCVVTEQQIWITPKDFTDAYGDNPLGKDDKPVLFVVKYANDSTIISAEPLGYSHNKFTYDVGEFSADQMRVINEGLAEIVQNLQDSATWFLNSRITSVRKVIDNKLVVDPMGVEMKDLTDRKPIIRLKSGVARSGVDTWIKQLEVQDVTASHIGDINTLWGFMQIGTGINDNALGQYNGGRRSAAEARTVNAGAASRLKTIATVLWETLFAPLGQKLLSNYANLEIDQFKKMVRGEATDERLALMKQTITDGCGFEFFDGTSPSEKGYIAQSLKDLLLGLLANPETAMMAGQPPFRSLIVEIADLMGIRSPERFLPPLQPPPALAAGQPQQPTNVTPITAANAAPGGTNPGGSAVVQAPAASSTTQ